MNHDQEYDSPPLKRDDNPPLKQGRKRAGFPPLNLLKLFGDYSSDQKGGIAVEFAMVSPIMIALVFGILNFGHAMFRYNEMQHVANETNRVITYTEITDEEAVQFAREQLGTSFSENITFTIERPNDEYRVLQFTGSTSIMTLVDIPYTALEHFKADFQIKSVSPEYKTSSFAQGR